MDPEVAVAVAVAPAEMGGGCCWASVQDIVGTGPVANACWTPGHGRELSASASLTWMDPDPALDASSLRLLFPVSVTAAESPFLPRLLGLFPAVQCPLCYYYFFTRNRGLISNLWAWRL